MSNNNNGGLIQVASLAALTSAPFFTHKAPSPESLRYGTAGFRMPGEHIPAIAARLGPVFLSELAQPKHRAAWCAAAAAMQQQQKQEQAGRRPIFFGAMVTASHNAAGDNGLKLVEPPHAHMLGGTGEALATTFARTKDAAEFEREVQALVEQDRMARNAEKEPIPANAKGTWGVVIGWDTRPSCAAIVDALAASVELFGGIALRAGQMSTPMLHWCVEMANEAPSSASSSSSADGANSILPPLSKYLNDRFASFSAAVSAVLAEQKSTTETRNRRIVVDCANGIGSLVMKDLVSLFEKSPIPGIHYTFELVNTATDDAASLNADCGADYVQKKYVWPKNMSAEVMSKHRAQLKDSEKDTILFYSLDGDADRLVAGIDNNSKANGATIFEGDRFTALFATILCKGSSSSSASSSLSYGAVQTAYANGSSTSYLKKCSNGLMKTEFALTGVKYVHKAAEAYDVGLYFESNGHGTVLASHKAQQEMMKKAAKGEEGSSSISKEGRAVLELVSQSCGDAVANLLATELALIALQWTPAQWLELYTDLPCVQQKVPVPDPAVFRCEEGNEQVLVAPAGAQQKINEIVKKVGVEGVRAFVRPSGTEPVVRLYVEAPELATAQQLAKELEVFVKALVA